MWLLRLSIVFFSIKLWGQVFAPQGNWNCNSSSSLTISGDTTNAQFLAGTTSNTTVTGSTVALSVTASSGTFTSRTVDIFATCNTFNAFNYFAWKTSQPFLKELPPTSESILDYPSAAVTLHTNLIGYWKFNEASSGTVSGGTKDFQDFSGNNNHASKTGSITLGTSGRFSNAISSANAGGYIDLPGVAALIPNTSSYTISAWFRLTTFTNGCGGSGTYLIDRAISGGGNPLAGICTKTSSFAFETRCDSGASLQQVIGSPVVLNTWQHVVIQRDRTAALYRIFGNGVQINTVADGGGCTVTLDPPRVGRHATGGAQGITGSIDEIMIWKRALTAAEILQVFRRGGNRLQFQFRACTSTTCADNPTWVGPDGTASTYFSELNNNSIQATGLGTVLSGSPTMTFTNFSSFTLPRNRYFQYRAYLNSESTANTPDFNWTEVDW